MMKWSAAVCCLAPVLALALVAGGARAAAGACAVAGQWQNQRQSKMLLVCDAAAPTALSGSYVSGVGHAAGAYALAGRYDPDSLTLGWSVAWTSAAAGSARSTTSWSAQYFPAEGVLCSTFLLSRFVNASADRWAAVLVGDDVFHRV